MSLFGIFGGDKSSSSSSTTSTNNALGADNGAHAYRVDTASGSVNIGSDSVANSAINAIQSAANSATTSANTNLAATENFLSDTLGKLFESVNTTQQGAIQNVAAAQQLASSLSSNQTATASQDLQKIVVTVGIIALIYFAITDGVFK